VITRLLRHVPLAAIIGLVAACGLRDDALNDMGPADEPAPVVIHIQNRAAQQATIFMIPDGGLRVRVGEVPSFSERYFEQQVWLGRTLEFDVRLLAGRTYRTSSVPAAPGDTVQVTIPSHI